MSSNPKLFAQLLSDGIHKIRLRQNKKISVIQDELGYMLGRTGAHAINHWRRGHIPADAEVVAILAHEIAVRGQVPLKWLENFLSAGGHPAPMSVLRNFSLASNEESVGGEHPFLAHVHPRFIGRSTHLDSLLAELRNPSGPRLLGIDGLGGIGKTALAYEIAQRAGHSGAFETTIWISAAVSSQSNYVPLENRALTFDEILTIIARRLGHPNPGALSLDDRMAWTRKELQRVRGLIVLDNLETAAEPQAQIIERLAHLLSESARAVLTSRQRFTGNIYEVHLTGLGDQESIQFMQMVAETWNLRHLLGARPEDFAAIIPIAGGSPLALKLITGQWGHMRLDVVLAHLKNVRPLEVDSQQDEYLALYKNIYTWSWQLLTENGQNLLLALWFFVPGQGGTLEALREVSTLDMEILPRHVQELWRLSLLEYDAHPTQPHYYIHALTQHFIRSDILKDSFFQEPSR